MENELLYIQEQMPKTKQTPGRPRGQGQGGHGRSSTRVPPVGTGRGKGNGLPSAVPGKHDSGRKHGGFIKGSGRVIITAAVAAARGGAKQQGASSQLPDLGRFRSMVIWGERMMLERVK